MKRFFSVSILLLWPCSALFAQNTTLAGGYLPDEGRAPYRTEFISYDIRGEADAASTSGSKYFRPLKFKAVNDGVVDTTTPTVFEAEIDIPGLWLDRNVYVRDTGRTGRYRLTVNDAVIGYNTDSYGTNDYLLSPFLMEGRNRITIEMLAPDTAGGDMENFTPPADRTTIDNLYIFSQPRIHIFDYTVSGHHDDEFKDDIVDLAVVVANGFNMPERVRVGYDVWDGAGERKDAVFREVTIAGRAVDTIRLRGKVMGTEKNQYSAANPALYHIVLSLRHAGRDIEYIPLSLGFGLTSYDGSTVSRGGASIDIRATEADFPQQAGTLEKLRALKKEGFNTIAVTRPQQKWFYDMAAVEGIYIIDRAAVDCDPRGGSRAAGGTVANDPTYINRFLDRQSAMFHRNRNRPNVIGWSIGSESGNGYNMYKSYQILKSSDPTRPVVYPWAEGEFNNDTITD